MHVSAGHQHYLWQGEWGEFPESEVHSIRATHSHHGVVVTERGEVMTFHKGNPSVLVFDTDGNFKRLWRSDLSNAHDLALAKDGDTEYLWLADNESGRVIKTTLDGETVMSLDRPDHPAYADADYKPTSVTVNQSRFGGNDDVWVTDGYGESLIHRYDRKGSYLSTIDGQAGAAGRFNGPHGIWVDNRLPEPRLYVADRTSARVQVYDLDGNYQREFGSDYMDSPSGFINVGDQLMIVEHRGARITVLDADDKLVGYLGENAGVNNTEGWPNNERGLHLPGKFNSPHGMAADADGHLYVVEWLTGGRMTKLVAA